MNTLKQHLQFLAVLIIVMIGVSSCQSNEDFLEVEVNPREEKAWQVCDLVFEGEVETFDGIVRTRSASWQANDTIYLLFTAGAEQVEGRAVYNNEDGIWQLHYYASLPNTTSATCKAYYFEGKHTVKDNEVELTPFTAVYVDTTATYSKIGRDVKVKAHLKPHTGRIRFKGEAGMQFKVSGFNCYNRYETAFGRLSSVGCDEFIEIGTDGYSPYFYGYFLTSPRMYIECDGATFRNSCGSYVLAKGKSGYMDLPTLQMHNGWKQMIETLTFEVPGASFGMEYVRGGSFIMGATEEQGDDAYSNESPAHSVTLSDYYIGTYEVTQGLWKAVMGTNPSSHTGDDELPVETVSWNDCQTFIQKLNQLTGETFSLPTEAQWEFAARGGIKSQGYKYSGSNNLDEVAYYISNSDYHTYPVGECYPNELCLYDMSGNVREWCNDRYGLYSNEAVTNPTGPLTGYYRVVRSGAYNNSARNCRLSCRFDFVPERQLSDTVLRLCLPD